jgi:hypothetical protein
MNPEQPTAEMITTMLLDMLESAIEHGHDVTRAQWGFYLSSDLMDQVRALLQFCPNKLDGQLCEGVILGCEVYCVPSFEPGNAGLIPFDHPAAQAYRKQIFTEKNEVNNE